MDVRASESNDFIFKCSPVSPHDLQTQIEP